MNSIVYVGMDVHKESEHSSGNCQNRHGITKAGNSHMRRLLVELAQSYTRGSVGHKSKDLKNRQKGNAPGVIAYSDKANERLRQVQFDAELHALSCRMGVIIYALSCRIQKIVLAFSCN